MQLDYSQIHLCFGITGIAKRIAWQSCCGRVKWNTKMLEMRFSWCLFELTWTENLQSINSHINIHDGLESFCLFGDAFGWWCLPSSRLEAPKESTINNFYENFHFSRDQQTQVRSSRWPQAFQKNYPISLQSTGHHSFIIGAIQLSDCLPKIRLDSDWKVKPSKWNDWNALPSDI